MSTASPAPDRLLLLGRDHEEYGRFALSQVSADTVAAISAGADAAYASSTQKRHVNEDALFVHEDARHTVVCVADAHFGREASEQLIASLADALVPVPENPERLRAVLARLADERRRDEHDSETTLVVCVLDRMFRQAFGVSYGDSSVVVAAPGELPQRENRHTTSYVTPARPRTMSPDRAEEFAFSPAKGDLILVFTDGVDECCYRDPDRSISPEILHELIERVGREPRDVTHALMELALAGVNGNPGGQDNVALVVTRV